MRKILFCFIYYHLIVFPQTNYSHPRVEIGLRLFHHSDTFRLQTDGIVNAPYIYRVYSAELKIIRYTLNPSKIQDFYRCYSVDRPLSYTYPGFTLTGPYPLHKDSAIFTQRIRFDRRPTCVYVFFVNSESAAGIFTGNPLFF